MRIENGKQMGLQLNWKDIVEETINKLNGLDEKIYSYFDNHLLTFVLGTSQEVNQSLSWEIVALKLNENRLRIKLESGMKDI